MDFDKKYEEYRIIFENYLNERVSGLCGNEKLVSAMKYSLLAGGKRVRPVLLLASAQTFGVKAEKALPFAFAVECVHTYSLIHDDLPAMDNDDLRRGKPTNHKVFGEDFAILAGDALLNLAFETCLENCSGSDDVSAVCFLAKCSGYKGMVGGQAYDLQPETEGEERLLLIDKLKTSKLISAPLKMGALLAGKSEEAELMDKVGYYIGVIYQFVDDLLDATGTVEVLGKAVKKDEDHGKLSAVSVYGTDGVMKQIESLCSECNKLLKSLKNSEFLQLFLSASTKRIS